MGPDDSFADLMARLGRGEQAAATDLHHRFAGPLLKRAFRSLDPAARGKADPEDILQSVFRSFFTRFGQGQFEDLHSWDHLWHLLAKITQRKCIDQNRRFRSDNGNVSRETTGNRTAAGLRTVADHNPTPAEEAAFVETLEILFARFEERNQRVLTLWLAGIKCEAISDQLGCTERTIFRVLERAEECLRKMQ